MAGIFELLRTTVFSWFIQPQTTFKVGLFSAKNSQTFDIICGQSITVQDVAIDITMWHSFSRFQKCLQLHPSSNNSKLISIIVKVARFESRKNRWEEKTKILTSLFIDSATYDLLIPSSCLIFRTIYILTLNMVSVCL